MPLCEIECVRKINFSHFDEYEFEKFFFGFSARGGEIENVRQSDGDRQNEKKAAPKMRQLFKAILRKE